MRFPFLVRSLPLQGRKQEVPLGKAAGAECLAMCIFVYVCCGTAATNVCCSNSAQVCCTEVARRHTLSPKGNLFYRFT